MQYVSRHGARYPTSDNSGPYDTIIKKLKEVNPDHFKGDYSFLAKYQYKLGGDKVDQLTEFGENELVNAGKQFYSQYSKVAQGEVPFIRASKMDRVVQSASKFADGFHQAQTDSGDANAKYPYTKVIIEEGKKFKNPLEPKNCGAFDKRAGKVNQTDFASVFVHDIQTRLKRDLHIADLSILDVINLMDLCPFETVASSAGDPSEFCNLFRPDEWKSYNYYQSLGKYYGFGQGNDLGPIQGVGFVNELIARLKGQQIVNDTTSVDHKLDDNPTTFPVDRKIYADFTHEDPMVSILTALGLFLKAPQLDVDATTGFSASRIVPFAARFAIEKMTCQQGEMVRVLVNERVVPLDICKSNEEGLCTKDYFVGNLTLRATDMGNKWVTSC